MQNLTVIIPFYNEKDFLLESVKRVLSLNIFEGIILSDDCSNDGSEVIAKKLADENLNVIYIKWNNNQVKEVL